MYGKEVINNTLSFLLLFICSRRDQSWATVCSSIRARRTRNHWEPKKCTSFGSIWLVLWYLSLAHIKHVQYFFFFFHLPEEVGLRQLQEFCTARFLLLWGDGYFYPNPAKRCRSGKEKTAGGWRGSTDTSTTAEELTATCPPNVHPSVCCVPVPLPRGDRTFSCSQEPVKVIGTWCNSHQSKKWQTC